jgi:hypothetical protein
LPASRAASGGISGCRIAMAGVQPVSSAHHHQWIADIQKLKKSLIKNLYIARDLKWFYRFSNHAH